MSVDGKLVNDFWLVEADRALHILNAPSPAATASLAIAAEVVAKMSTFQASVASPAGKH
jgi:L-2-hydroxyglutarate oxidase